METQGGYQIIPLLPMKSKKMNFIFGYQILTANFGKGLQWTDSFCEVNYVYEGFVSIDEK